MNSRIRRALVLSALALMLPAVALAQTDRTEVEVAQDILATYVGVYELAPTVSITVRLEDGALFAQVTGQQSFPIFAESEAKFFFTVVDAQVSFTKDDSGEVTRMTLHQDGANQPAPKVSSEVPPPPDLTGGRTEVEVAQDILQKYVGEYELVPGVSVTMTLEGGALFAEITGQPQVALFAESDTEFFLKAVDAQVTFTTDDSGAATGIILHQGGADQRARKIR